jgi:extracellular elastinolytic metalloproteinase
MTGGGTAGCLQTLESGSLGEGWSDAMAEYVIFYLTTILVKGC